MSSIDGKGVVAGIITWLIIMFFWSDMNACINSVKGCKGDDFMLSGVLSVGFLFPSWIVAYFVSNSIKTK